MASMMIQLQPPIPLETPRGSGLAHLVIDYGPEFSLLWSVFLDDSGECWTFTNEDVRAVKNITMGRTAISKIAGGDEAARPRKVVATAGAAGA